MGSSRNANWLSWSSWSRAQLIDLAIPFVMTSVGFLHPESPSMFFSSLAYSYVGVGSGIIALTSAFDWLASHYPRIQFGAHKHPELWISEALETARSMYVFSCFAAWPLTQHRLGYDTAVTWQLGGPFGLVVVLIQAFIAIIALDAYLYWKHRMLHQKFFWGFHKKHHTFSDPTSYGAFSVGPMESVLTYWMLPALCQTTFKIWAPINMTIVALFVLQNCYLHCGARIDWLEYYMLQLKMDTSSFHNTHHLLSKGNYGEALTIWDNICGTRLDAQLARLQARNAAKAADALAASTQSSSNVINKTVDDHK